MEPDGDPEARIRDLERPLTDRAQATELGTQPYEAQPSSAVPVPPFAYSDAQPPSDSPTPSAYLPPPAYPPQAGFPEYAPPPSGSPYYAPPQRVVNNRPQVALWLIPLVIIAIAVAGVIGAVAWFNVSSTDVGPAPRPVAPSIAGGGGQLDRPGAVVPVPPADDVVTVGPGESVTFGGVNQKKTIVCTQGTVNISGMTNTIEVQGDCAEIAVSGMTNIVTVQSATTITASGFDNKITFHLGAPQISTSGTGNVVAQG
jgi:hypothetical protein